MRSSSQSLSVSLSTPIPIESIPEPRAPSGSHSSRTASQQPHPQQIDLEEDLRQKQNELKESKKLLNLYCSPQHRARVGINQNQQNMNITSMNNSFQFNSIRNTNKDNAMKIPDPFEKGNVLPAPDDRTSVQLTPYHTPIVKSKTRAFTSSNQSSSQYNPFQNNNNNNNSN